MHIFLICSFSCFITTRALNMFVSNLTRMPPKDSVNLDINHEVNKLDGKFSHSGKNVKTQGVKNSPPSVYGQLFCMYSPRGRKTTNRKINMQRSKRLQCTFTGLESASNYKYFHTLKSTIISSDIFKYIYFRISFSCVKKKQLFFFN